MTGSNFTVAVIKFLQGLQARQQKLEFLNFTLTQIRAAGALTLGFRAVQEIQWPFGARIYELRRGFGEGAGLKTL
jgi:hypothetical protein